MPYLITIETKKDTGFTNEAKTILESHSFTEINPKTYIGTKSSQPIVQQLKVLEIYKKDKSNKGISIYHGTISKV